MIGVLDGLVTIHGAEIVHRDIRPGNVALRHNAWTNPVILDLGLVRDLMGDSITVYPNLLGTIPFMSPNSSVRSGRCAGRTYSRPGSCSSSC
jgi:eukaryotic-like serine/threonine-protein kinase